MVPDQIRQIFFLCLRRRNLTFHFGLQRRCGKPFRVIFRKSFFQFSEQCQRFQHIVHCTVCVFPRDLIVAAECFKASALQIREGFPCNFQRIPRFFFKVQTGIYRCLLDEAVIEQNIVPQKRQAAAEIQKAADSSLHIGRIRNHLIPDSGEFRDPLRHFSARIDESLIRCRDLSALHFYCTDLQNLVFLYRKTRCLKIEHYKILYFHLLLPFLVSHVLLKCQA